MLKKASEHYQWNLDYGMLAKIWRKGCIIRSVFLEQITRAYHALPGLENLLFDDFSETEYSRLCLHGERLRPTVC